MPPDAPDPGPHPTDLQPLAPARVLAFDGGPSASLQIRILRYVEEKRPGFLASTQVFAGTSDGAFNALYLAANSAPGPDAHERNLKVIDDCIAFSNEILEVFHPNACDELRFLSGLGPLIPGERLRCVLEQHYGDVRMDELRRSAAMMSFCKTTGAPCVITNLKPVLGPRWSLVEAALASSAFPVILPIYLHGPSGLEFIDGGFSANNPTLAAVSCYIADQGREPPADGVTYSPVLALSLGARQTPRRPRPLHDAIRQLLRRLRGDPSFLDWGYLAWLLHDPLREAESILLGSAEESAQELRRVLGDDFMRYQPAMNEIGATRQIFSRPTRVVIRELDELAARLIDSHDVDLVLDWIADRGWVETTPEV